MPTFVTPEPISVTIELELGDVQLTASERTDTVVEVRPSDSSRDSDVSAAEQTRVEFSNGELFIKGPKRRLSFGKGWSIDLAVALPADSKIRVETGLGNIKSDGRLAEFKAKTGLGNMSLDQIGDTNLTTGLGDISVRRAGGRTSTSTGSGKVRINRTEANAEIKNSNGTSWVGEAVGRLQVSGANGDIEVGRAHADLEAKTANGAIRLGEAIRGEVLLETSNGQVEIGIHRGTAALLDVRSSAGRVYNELDAAAGPESTDETLSLRARTHAGNVVIRRA